MKVTASSLFPNGNELFGVTPSRTCEVLKKFWYNGEGWYKLRDLETSEVFESPDIFWEDSK